jgi:hypothetical protein
MLLPICRAKLTDAVAAPRSLRAALFCAMRTMTCRNRPRPRPRISRYPLEARCEVRTPIVDSRYRPAAASAVPATG